MDIPAALDRFVHRARLDVLTPFAVRRSRNLRWLPLLVIIALPAGYALQMGVARGQWASWQAGFAGTLIFVAGLVAASLLRLFGPRIVPETGQRLDERELLLRARAGHISGAIITLLAALGCFYAASAEVFGTWVPASAIEWVFLGLGVQGYALVLPVLVASWLQPAPDGEEE